MKTREFGIANRQFRKRTEQTVRPSPTEATIRTLGLISQSHLKEIQGRIGIMFRDPRLLEEAFVHRSFLNESRRKGLHSNERLEFLGDKVLGAALGQFLFRKLPEASEGKMTDIFGVMASGQMLGQIAERLGLANFLLMSKGQRTDMDARARSRVYLLANLFEAIVGAIYLDRGPGTVELFLDSCLFPRIDRIVAEGLFKDAKSRLQELSQEKYQITPHYEIIFSRGPDHDKAFAVGAFLGERKVGQGNGSSRHEAEMEAARDALKKVFQVTLSES